MKDRLIISRRFLARMDWWLILAAFGLLLFGLAGVYSATMRQGIPEVYLFRQISYIFFGIFFLILVVSVNYQFLFGLGNIVYLFSTFLLIAVLLFGTTLRGTRGWFHLIYFYFQPTEITKFLFIIFLAELMVKNWRNIVHWRSLIYPTAMLLFQVFLILLQPDFSATLVYFPVFLTILFLAGARLLHLLVIILFGLLAGGIPLISTLAGLELKVITDPFWLNVWKAIFLVTAGGQYTLVTTGAIVLLIFFFWYILSQLRYRIPFIYALVLSLIIISGTVASRMVVHSLKEYQRRRLIVFLSPSTDPLGAGYNVLQSKIAIGSGGIFGRGLFGGTQSHLGFLPEQHTDFIFAVIAEELGFLGSLWLLSFYFLLVYRAYIIARDARDKFGSLIAAGICSAFAFYGIINVGMVLGLMPATGLPLPFVSYGGSQIVGSFIALGLLLNIRIRKFTV